MKSGSRRSTEHEPSRIICDEPGTQAAGRCAARVDTAWLASLIAVVTIAWCGATASWSPAAFMRAPLYLEDPSKSDVMLAYATLEANVEGDAAPFVWKTVTRLNAPFAANWTDFPSLDECQGLTLLVLANIFGVFGGLNAVLLLGHLLAAGTFFFVARVSGCSTLWAFVGGLAYGLAPFMFAQSPHHSAVQWAWHVPLFTLVWRWVATDPGLVRGTPRLRAATGIGFLTGLLNVYYTNILCQLTLLGAGVQFLRNRARPALLAAVCVIGAAAIGFAIANLDTWTYKAVHGSNSGALVREYKWLEIYGLKIKDLFIPPVNHRSKALASFGTNHRKEAVLNDEDGCPYQGLVGLACLIWLVGTSAMAVIRRREYEIPMEAWQVLWIVLMFTTGGLNAILGAIGFTMFRSGARYSVVILAITLLWAARRLSAMQATAATNDGDAAVGRIWLAGGAVLCGLILWDQVPRAPSRELRATIDSRVASDREFTERMEASLPAGAMVFQLPVMEFPESPMQGVPPYDHFRPYVFSTRLRFSFGTHKGRDRDTWQAALQAKLFEGASLDRQAGRIELNVANARIAVEELERLGFSAMYINRNGFPDGGQGLERALRELGYTKPPIQNAMGDLACIPLERE